MGFLDDIISQQSGGGMLGGLPATWQYTNPDSLNPAEKQMMGLVGTQNPDQAGFAPLPAPTGAFPVNGAAPIGGVTDNGSIAPTAPAVPPTSALGAPDVSPTPFGAGASPVLFANPAGSTPGNPAMPPPASAPVVASDDGEDDVPAAKAPAAPVSVGNYQMPRVGTADQFTPNPAALPVNAQATQGLGTPGQAAAAATPGSEPGFMTGYQNFRHGGGIIGSIVAAVTGKRNDNAGVAQQQQTQIANLTARALVNKGVAPELAIAAVQPGNAEMLKTLVDANFKPKDPMNLGSGYILRPGAAKAERMFEPDDKTPAGFEKTANGLRPIAGGPADPAYLRLAEAQKKDPNANIVLGRGGEIVRNNPDGSVTVMHKNADISNDAASIDDKTAKLLAERVLAGDTKALTGLGRGAQGAANILKIHKLASDIAEEKGMDAQGVLNNVAKQAQLVSSARALGTKETHFGVAEKAMEESLPLAQAASDALPRSDWMLVNKLVQSGQTQHSNPVLKKFLIATDTAAKDYARTINPTGALRESDIEYARKILSTADGPGAYTAALEQLQMEAGVMHRAIERQKGQLYGKGDAHPAAAAPPTAYVWSPEKGLAPK
jgi:hypothetical protein